MGLPSNRSSQPAIAGGLGARLESNYGLVPDVPDDADYHNHDAQRGDSDCSQAVLPIAVAFHPKRLRTSIADRARRKS